MAYDDPLHRKDNIHKVRLNQYEDAKFRKVAHSLGLQPAVLGREMVEAFTELMGDPDIVKLAGALKCSTTALIQKIVIQGAQELKALLAEQSSKRLRA